MPWKFITPNIECEVSYKKAPNKLLAPKPPVYMRTWDPASLVVEVDENGFIGEIYRKLTPVTNVRVVKDRKFLWKGKGRTLATETEYIDTETGERVPSSEVLEILEHYGYRNLDDKGNEVEKEIIYHFAETPEGVKMVRPFNRSNILDIPEENWVPSTCIDEFLILSVYEIFSDKKAVIRELFAEAERRLKKDQIGITAWSWGGFKQGYAFVCPYMKEGKFGWLVKFSDTQPELVHSQEIPTKVKVPIREAPTLKTLPPVQALVVAAKRKKK